MACNFTEYWVKLGFGTIDPAQHPRQVLARIYCAFSAMWSLGANLHEAGRFRQHMRELQIAGSFMLRSHTLDEQNPAPKGNMTPRT